jgi:hypothetical protein
VPHLSVERIRRRERSTWEERKQGRVNDWTEFYLDSLIEIFSNVTVKRQGKSLFLKLMLFMSFSNDFG